ncbi:MAG: hypothetical protein APF80_17465 [Alphaproteobacteria bacterium BRH_c36]|nr:MAG: hypothetical protein APF80_17465 [Alphaproteobacteria bacterium BRH_c36]
MAKVITTSSRVRGPGLFSPARSLKKQNRAQTDQLLHQLNGAIQRSPLSDPTSQERLARELVFEVLGADPYDAAFRDAFANTTLEIIRQELTPLYSLPTTGTDAASDYEARNQIRLQLEYFENEAAHLAAWREQLTRLLHLIARAAPERRPTNGALSFGVPLFTVFANPTQTIDDMVRLLVKSAPDPNEPTRRPGDRLASAIITNLLATSRLTPEDAQKRPYRLTWPGDVSLGVSQLPETYLARTPLLPLLQTRIEIMIPSDLRTEHAIVTATIGHGKTQLMQSLIMRDLADPARPSIVVIDSQGDAVSTLARLKRFDPAGDDRLILIDPTDEQPPALNLFHWDRAFAATLSDNQREEYLAGVVEMFGFIAGGLLGAELTARMSVVFRFISQLLIEIPNASIHTLIQLLQDPAPFMQHIAALPPTAQTFIDELFSDRSQYKQTRQHLLQRLYHIISNPAFERMFAHPQNKFDMRAALNDGKVVLINTAKAQLKAEWSSIFGRFFVAQIMQAAFARAFIPREQRRLALIHIDECHEYLDDNISMLMLQGRKYATALHLYHQHFSQMTEAGLKQTALSIPALRYTGSLNDTDATLLAKEMKTSPEFLKAVSKTNRGAEWSLYVRNLTPTATKIFVPFLSAEHEPKMSKAAYQQLLARNRALVGAPRRPHTPPPTPTTPISNNGDSY